MIKHWEPKACESGPPKDVITRAEWAKALIVHFENQLVTSVSESENEVRPVVIDFFRVTFWMPELASYSFHFFINSLVKL